MANIRNLSAILAGDKPLHAVITNNFKQVRSALNSNNVNSENYSDFSIESNKIATSQILSQHFADSSMNSAKFSSGVIVETHIDRTVTAGGVRAPIIGSAPPANGVMACRMTQSVDLASSSAFTFTFVFSDGIHGDPGFTAAPIVRNFGVLLAATTDSGPIDKTISAVDSASVVIYCEYSATQDVNQTFYLMAKGPV